MLSTKLLIIDDEQEYCMMMKGFLQVKGYDVTVSYRLKEGLKLLHEIKPAILILDNNLPDGNGWDHCFDIAAQMPELQIHLVSAHRHKSELKDLPHSVTVWEKPISLNELERTFHKQT